MRSVNSSTGPLLPTQPVSLPTQPVSLPTQPQPQRLGVASQPQQVIRAGIGRAMLVFREGIVK